MGTCATVHVSAGHITRNFRVNGAKRITAKFHTTLRKHETKTQKHGISSDASMECYNNIIAELDLHTLLEH